MLAYSRNQSATHSRITGLLLNAIRQGGLAGLLIGPPGVWLIGLYFRCCPTETTTQDANSIAIIRCDTFSFLKFHTYSDFR